MKKLFCDICGKELKERGLTACRGRVRVVVEDADGQDVCKSCLLEFLVDAQKPAIRKANKIIRDARVKAAVILRDADIGFRDQKDRS